MHIELERSFSRYMSSRSAAENDGAGEESVPAQLKWPDLLSRDVSVVLGEAGIGKTVEFQLQARRLAQSNHPAFFISLNMLKSSDDWEVALDGASTAFERWQIGNLDGVFLLDALDEARLASHSDFTRALAIVRRALEPHMSRVRVVLSSRITDWRVAEVAATVADKLVRPIADARARVRPAPPNDGHESAGREEPAAFVVTLAPLHRVQAKRCAQHFGLIDPSAFWDAVDNGHYQFMACRPLDLRWMVSLWNSRKRLGTYRELLEAYIGACIDDVNPSYQQAGKVLSRERLLDGAARLAAAAEFGGQAYISPQRSGTDDMLQAQDVLNDWNSAELRVLLSTTIFQELGFGRVGFHHRVLREYLAAYWVDRKIHKGVPLNRIRPLFIGQPFGESVLIPVRRAVLSWLAALNVQARDWVVSRFPELLLNDGDPESWDQRSVDEALKIYTKSTRHERKARWALSRSTCTRIGRVVTPALVVAIMEEDDTSDEALSLVYKIARWSKMEACAEPAFANYLKAAGDRGKQTEALSVLAEIGTPTHRAHVLADLEAHRLHGNDLVAEALSVIDWRRVPAARLTATLDQTDGEFEEDGYGPMSLTIRELLPRCTLADAVLLLQAVRDSRPSDAPSVLDRGNRGWRYEVLVDCLELVLILARHDGQPLVQACIDAAVYIDDLRIAGMVDGTEVARLHRAIASFPAARWPIALAIARSEPICFSRGRLAGGGDCVVTLGSVDFYELARRAGDPGSNAAERAIWTELGEETAGRMRRGSDRAAAIRALLKLPGPSAIQFQMKYQELLSLARSRRLLATKAGKAAVRAARGSQADTAKIAVLLNARRASIADGTDTESLLRFVNCAYTERQAPCGRAVDMARVATLFGSQLTDAFSQGLSARLGMNIPDSPLSHDSRKPQHPASVRVAQAAVDRWIAGGMDCAILSSAEVTTAARVAVWSEPGMSDWFAALCRAKPEAVVDALTPWLLEEIGASPAVGAARPTLALTLACPLPVRNALLVSTVQLVLASSVPNEPTLRQLALGLHAANLITATNFDALCSTQLERRKDSVGRILDLEWLMVWMRTRPRAAWDWFAGHLASLGAARAWQVDDFAGAMWESKEIWGSLEQETDGLLSEISECVFGPDPGGHPGLAMEQNRNTRRLFMQLTRQLHDTPGLPGRQALQRLLGIISDEWRRQRLHTSLIVHAEREAAVVARWAPERLRSLHSPFDSAPASEAQLYEQVLARLEDIRTSVEEGPFSERVLFHKGILEKYLQLWLAAKLQDTQNRRFSIHREEEVDDDKRTDIQCACTAGNVCVEIKPLDSHRGYSATSLVDDTLKRQIVGQYLKGWNSASGILVLLQLDNKKWTIAGAAGKEFDALVKYVQKEADKIRASKPEVVALHVFGIRCV